MNPILVYSVNKCQKFSLDWVNIWICMYVSVVVKIRDKVKMNHQKAIFVSESCVFEGDAIIFQKSHVHLVSKEPKPHVLFVDMQPGR